ncbi:glycoside hydrolase family 5 protein [Piedraia hortae CBS 480.64]|uniref:glucan 1,3-beta-glucosidase n=1 Tax=Piedraia hortae CBS 480.64 TaxID=1314780 RepID=A0A6A7C1W7_9PEZI|nr:glycoside hydrolase family 5 protein [Piedraia hortae CBS 480.64]
MHSANSTTLVLSTRTASSNQTAPSTPTVSPGSPSYLPSLTPKSSDGAPFRGVNIGGWLILEPWMNSDLFNGIDAKDQCTFDKVARQNDTLRQSLYKHWDTYFTEADMQKLASWGINAVRIPIGYWAYRDPYQLYITGADAYLERAIGWAREYGIKVLVDCHGSPGSQNGFDNSGQAGAVEWQQQTNQDLSIEVLKQISRKYGAQSYADVVFAIELVNEPISWGANKFDVIKDWAQKAAAAVKQAATNNDLEIIMHDAFQGAQSWGQTGSTISRVTSPNFALDLHLYQNQDGADLQLDQEQHIQKACDWAKTALNSSSGLSVYVGEFSSQTNICVSADGKTTTAGSSCQEEGCQCSATLDVSVWHQPLIDASRRFLEAELDAFERASRGWFLWSYKGPGAWGLDNMMRYGLMGPHKVTDRQFPCACTW